MIALDLQSLKNAYAEGRMTPSALMRNLAACLDAYPDEAVWIYRRPVAALIAAGAALEARGPEAKALPLYGVPFAVKDNIDVAGVPTTAGCPAFSYVPEETAPVVAALEAAGALFIGKTNLDQFATGLNGTRSPYGAPRCVFNRDYVSGGSSSGSAVAVAAGLVSFALGTDTAGSGRVPAAFNNIVGWKPSKGLLSTRGVVPACRSIDCVSVFALSAADARTVAAVAGVFDAGDPFARAFAPRPLDLQAPVIGIPSKPDYCGDTASEAIYKETVARAEALGFKVETFDYTPLAEAAALLYGGPLVAERYAAVGAFIEAHEGETNEVVRKLILAGKDRSAIDLFSAQHRLAELKRVIDAMWQRFDALLLPTAPTIYTVAAMEADPVTLNSNLGLYTNFVNLLDCAAIAVPAGFCGDGLPFGVTLVGPAMSDFDLGVLADRLHRASNAGGGAARIAPKPMNDAPVPGLIDIAVVGAHLTGEPLNHELTSRGGVFVRAAKTAADYRFFALANTAPPKPGLKREAGFEGTGIALEIWRLTAKAFGEFTAGVPAPLAIGTVTLEDGRMVKGFVAEPAAFEGARDITEFGGWRAYRAALPKS